MRGFGDCPFTLEWNTWCLEVIDTSAELTVSLKESCSHLCDDDDGSRIFSAHI